MDGPFIAGEFQVQADGLFAAGIVVYTEGGGLPLSRMDIGGYAVRGDQPAVFLKREETIWIGCPEGEILVGVTGFPAGESVYVEGGLGSRQVQAPWDGVAMHIGREGVRCGAVFFDLEGVDKCTFNIVHGQGLDVGREIGSLNGAVSDRWEKADVARVVRTEEFEGFLVACVFVTARGFDEVVFAVCNKSPGGFLAVAVEGDGDVEGVDTGTFDLCRESNVFRLARTTGYREAVVWNRDFLEYLPVWPHEEGTQVGLPVVYVPVVFCQMDDEFAGFGQEVRAARTAQEERDFWFVVHWGPRFGFKSRMSRKVAKTQREKRWQGYRYFVGAAPCGRPAFGSQRRSVTQRRKGRSGGREVTAKVWASLRGHLDLI